MIHLLKLLIFGHVHKWETVETANWRIEGMDGTILKNGKKFICRCETCGSYTAFEVW